MVKALCLMVIVKSLFMMLRSYSPLKQIWKDATRHEKIQLSSILTMIICVFGTLVLYIQVQLNPFQL